MIYFKIFVHFYRFYSVPQKTIVKINEANKSYYYYYYKYINIIIIIIIIIII